MKILVVLPRFPYPLEKGDKLRAFNQIRSLAALGNEVSLFCVSHTCVTEEQKAQLAPYCKEIEVVKLHKPVCCFWSARNFFVNKSIQIGYWDSKRSRKAYKAFEARVEPDVIYSQMVRTMPLVSRSPIPKVMDFQDALSMNMERRMTMHRPGFKHFAYHFEFKMLRSTEYNSFSIFDALTIISEPDSEAIPHRKNGEINIVPNGVDFDYFKPLEREKKYDIVFCGNMQYQPNVDASKFLVNEVMPYVWKVIPDAKLLLAGATPVREVKKLASDNVIVSGTVDDIRECYASAKTFVAPMRIGSGLQNKLLEAMAMQIPCVTSSIANHALGAEAGKEVLVADKPEDIADHIIDLLQQDQVRNEMAKNGYEFVKKNYCWEKFGQQLNDILYRASNRHI